MIVADTNLIAYLLIEGEQTKAARNVWQRDPHWIVPTLWRSELLSVLTVSIRAGLFPPSEGLGLFQRSINLFGRSEREPDGEAVLLTALELGISAYDAQFVVTARDAKVKLVTSDRRLLKACPQIALSMDAFGA